MAAGEFMLGSIFALLLLPKCTSSAVAVFRPIAEPAPTADEPTIVPPTDHRSSTFDRPCNGRQHCSVQLHELCDRQHGRCACQSHAQYDALRGACRPCPDAELACTLCCTSFGYKCVDGACVNCYGYENYNRCWPERPSTDVTSAPITAAVIYVTASQIALLAALIMGSVALITLLYRVCSKPAIGSSGTTIVPGGGISTTNNSNRCHMHHAQAATTTGVIGGQPHLQTAFQRLSQRLSMTSMQARILLRLRDQPPKYEQQCNSNSAIAAATIANTTVITTAAIAVGQSAATGRNNVPMGTAPPCYDNDAYSIDDLPPPYTADGTGNEMPSATARRMSTASIRAPHLSVSSSAHANDIDTPIMK